MSNRIELPETGSRAGIFCVFLMLGHKVTYRSWNQITGLQGANQRADDLRRLYLPLDAPQYQVQWAKTPISVYQFSKSFIDELGERKEAYIKAVTKRHEHDADVIKGLQSKPQPLKSILAGKLINGGG